MSTRRQLSPFFSQIIDLGSCRLIGLPRPQRKADIGDSGARPLSNASAEEPDVPSDAKSAIGMQENFLRAAAQQFLRHATERLRR
jgi:hypothetical protein